MDGYDFRRIDREIERNLSDWNPRMALEKPPPKIELVPIGVYDGGKLLSGCHVLDESYIVYMEVKV